MRAFGLTALMMTLLSACSAGSVTSAFCGPDFGHAIEEHADALLLPGVPRETVVTGERVVSAYDAGCAP